MEGLVLMYKRLSFLQVSSLFFYWYHCKHIFDKKNWVLLTDLSQQTFAGLQDVLEDEKLLH